MSLSLADLPTELLDQAVPLIDFEDQVRLSSTYCGACWCRWSLRMPNYRSTTSRTAAGRRIPKALREMIKSLGASSPEGVMERRSSAVVDATIEARVTGSAPASLISLGEMPAVEWIELVNSFGMARLHKEDCNDRLVARLPQQEVIPLAFLYTWEEEARAGCHERVADIRSDLVAGHET
ncbi:hypothetical protein MCOR18_003270 [Pyricularia oryzae]|nr:hypothetical protein MCOR18_003270 [Pyricularia oryzae]